MKLFPFDIEIDIQSTGIVVNGGAICSCRDHPTGVLIPVPRADATLATKFTGFVMAAQEKSRLNFYIQLLVVNLLSSTTQLVSLPPARALR